MLILSAAAASLLLLDMTCIFKDFCLCRGLFRRYADLLLDDPDHRADLDIGHGLGLDIDGAGQLRLFSAAEVECAVAESLQGDGCLVADAGDLILPAVDLRQSRRL